MKRKHFLFGGFVVLLLFSLFLLELSNPYDLMFRSQESDLNFTVMELILMVLSITLFITYAIIVSVTFGFLIGMFIDCLQRPSERFPGAGEYDKLIWCLGIFFANFVGAVMYYFLVYRKMDWRVADEH